MNRLFIWAMPLVGFVGTVYGVSYGIGGFAEEPYVAPHQAIPIAYTPFDEEFA